MLYNKRPLIYIPKKKKIVQGSGPTPTPEVLGGVWVKSQYLNYSVTLSAFYPSRISFNPSKITYRGNTFPVGGKDTYSFTAGTSNCVTVIPIRGTSSSGADFVSRAGDMRWAPLDLDLFTASGINWDVPYLFFIPNGSSYTNVYKFKDSTKTGDQYSFTQRIIAEAIAGTSNPTFYLNKLDRLTDIQSVYSKLASEGVPQVGCLVATDKDFTFWTDPSLLAFANVFLQANYGQKTAVVEIDLGV